jgi:hypothetical protein
VIGADFAIWCLVVGQRKHFTIIDIGHDCALRLNHKDILSPSVRWQADVGYFFFRN